MSEQQEASNGVRIEVDDHTAGWGAAPRHERTRGSARLCASVLALAESLAWAEG